MGVTKALEARGSPQLGLLTEMDIGKALKELSM
jgi:hypothetical protein